MWGNLKLGQTKRSHGSLWNFNWINRKHWHFKTTNQYVGIKVNSPSHSNGFKECFAIKSTGVKSKVQSMRGSQQKTWALLKIIREESYLHKQQSLKLLWGLLVLFCCTWGREYKGWVGGKNNSQRKKQKKKQIKRSWRKRGVPYEEKKKEHCKIIALYFSGCSPRPENWKTKLRL